MAAGWLCRHLYEHYQYTLDQSFLEETAYPLLYKAAKFYADVLVEDGAGWLVFAPSTSPENRYRKGDFNGALSVTTAMTMSIIREVFEECVQAAGKLGKEDSFIQTLSDKLKRLRPLQTGSDGRIPMGRGICGDRSGTPSSLPSLCPVSGKDDRSGKGAPSGRSLQKEP